MSHYELASHIDISYKRQNQTERKHIKNETLFWHLAEAITIQALGF